MALSNVVQLVGPEGVGLGDGEGLVGAQPASTRADAVMPVSVAPVRKARRVIAVMGSSGLLPTVRFRIRRRFLGRHRP
jgi:hypothetical protein